MKTGWGLNLSVFICVHLRLKRSWWFSSKYHFRLRQIDIHHDRRQTFAVRVRRQRRGDAARVVCRTCRDGVAARRNAAPGERVRRAGQGAGDRDAVSEPLDVGHDSIGVRRCSGEVE